MGRRRLDRESRRRTILLHRLSENRASHPAGYDGRPGKSPNPESLFTRRRGVGPNISSRRNPDCMVPSECREFCARRGCGTRGPKEYPANRSGILSASHWTRKRSTTSSRASPALAVTDSITYSVVTDGSQSGLLSIRVHEKTLRAPPFLQPFVEINGSEPQDVDFHTMGARVTPRWTSGAIPRSEWRTDLKFGGNLPTASHTEL